MVYGKGNLNGIDQINIINDSNNNSDHRLVEILYTAAKQSGLVTPTHKTIKKFKWLDDEYQTLYKYHLKNQLQKSGITNILIPTEKDKKKLVITIKINIIHHCMTQAKSIATTKTTKRIKHKKFNPWWDEEIIRLHKMYQIKLNEYRNLMKFTNYVKTPNLAHERELIKLKTHKIEAWKLFKERQKQNIDLLKTKQYRKLNNLFLNDRTEGWKAFKNMFRVTNKVCLTANEAKIAFEKHFTEKLVPDSPELPTHQLKVNNFISNYSGTSEEFKIEPPEIAEILKNLKNGKRPGFAGVSYEQFKYSESDILNQQLCVCLQ